jgi:glycosyltransferase involved in cell wall biosynthesis
MTNSKKFRVFIPVFNEERNITYVIKDLLTVFHLNQIIVINDGSTDSTQEIVQSLGVEVVKHNFNIGVGAALKTAANISLERNLDYFIFFDGDGQHIASETMSLLNVFDGKGVVIGSRLLLDHKRDFVEYDMGTLKMIAILMLAKIFEKKFGLRIYDITSGFRIYGSDTFSTIASIKQNFYLSDTVIVLNELLKINIRVKEVSINMRSRLHGTSSSTNLSGFVNYLRTLYALISRH